MIKQFSSLKLQAKLIVIITPALLVGSLLTVLALWTVTTLDEQVHQLSEGVRNTVEANHASIAAARLTLAATNFLMTQKSDYYEEQTRMATQVDDYLFELSIYVQHKQSTGNPAIEQALADASGELTTYFDTWPDYPVDDSGWDDGEFQEGVGALDFSSGVQDQLNLIYTTMSDIELGRSDIVEQSAFTFSVAGGVGILLFIVLVIVTVMMINSQVAFPLAKLQAAADKLAIDEFDPAEIQHLAERIDEIGYLARSFLKTAEDVNRVEQELEDQAADYRTKINNLKRIDTDGS